MAATYTYDADGIVTAMTASGTILGTYDTTSTFGDDGQQILGVTTGASQNLAGKDTGSYTTTSSYDATYGVLASQVTDGISFSYGKILGVWTKYTSGRYHTTSTNIDGYGTVRASQTVGVTGRDINTASEKVLGTYTTNSAFGEDGQQTSGVTIGASQNLAGMATGSYTTTSHYNATYGVMDKQGTIGSSISYDKNGNS